MVYTEKSENNYTSIENEIYYTPLHHYNTRLSARIHKNENLQKTNSNINISKSLDYPRTIEYTNEETYVIERFENHSDRFSTCSTEYSNELLNIENFELYDSRIKKSLIRVNKRMDFSEPPCGENERKTFWFRNGAIILIAAIIGWYVNHVRMQLINIKAELESSNNRINSIQDDRLDTVYKLSEISNSVKDLMQSQNNLKQSIHNMIEQEINKMYSDKTGRTDFALESAGGRIVQLSPGTENYGQPKNSLLGISLCEGMHGPRAMIQTGTSPGECWAFKGSNGGAIIKLLGAIKIDAVSIEHISKNISPSGDSTTAPKDFTVWGLKTPSDRGTLLGQYSYIIQGPLVQMFPVSHPSTDSYELVELRIVSNHGNPDFTCVYRFRVHGEMEKP